MSVLFPGMQAMAATSKLHSSVLLTLEASGLWKEVVAADPGTMALLGDVTDATQFVADAVPPVLLVSAAVDVAALVRAFLKAWAPRLRAGFGKPAEFSLACEQHDKEFRVLVMSYACALFRTVAPELLASRCVGSLMVRCVDGGVAPQFVRCSVQHLPPAVWQRLFWCRSVTPQQHASVAETAARACQQILHQAPVCKPALSVAVDQAAVSACGGGAASVDRPALRKLAAMKEVVDRNAVTIKRLEQEIVKLKKSRDAVQRPPAALLSVARSVAAVCVHAVAPLSLPVSAAVSSSAAAARRLTAIHKAAATVLKKSFACAESVPAKPVRFFDSIDRHALAAIVASRGPAMFDVASGIFSRLGSLTKSLQHIQDSAQGAAFQANSFERVVLADAPEASIHMDAAAAMRERSDMFRRMIAIIMCTPVEQAGFMDVFASTTLNPASPKLLGILRDARAVVRLPIMKLLRGNGLSPTWIKTQPKVEVIRRIIKTAMVFGASAFASSMGGDHPMAAADYCVANDDMLHDKSGCFAALIDIGIEHAMDQVEKKLFDLLRSYLMQVIGKDETVDTCFSLHMLAADLPKVASAIRELRNLVQWVTEVSSTTSNEYAPYDTSAVHAFPAEFQATLRPVAPKGTGKRKPRV